MGRHHGNWDEVLSAARGEGLRSPWKGDPETGLQRGGRRQIRRTAVPSSARSPVGKRTVSARWRQAPWRPRPRRSLRWRPLQRGQLPALHRQGPAATSVCHGPGKSGHERRGQGPLASGAAGGRRCEGGCWDRTPACLVLQVPCSWTDQGGARGGVSNEPGTGQRPGPASLHRDP